MSLLAWLLDPSGLTPHGFCLTWEPGLIALHAGSDTLVGLSYLSIPLAIITFVRRRPDLQYDLVAYQFVGFILACGTTHLMSVLTLWVPAYGIEGVIKAVTAILFVTTALLLWPMLPRLVALPSPAQLVSLNKELSNSLGQMERMTVSLRESEARGRAANVELERRVAERTADLQAANQQLTEALEARDSALRALARSESELRASFEGAAVGKVIAEPHSRRILRVNQAFARMLGFEPEELVGRTSRELTFPEDVESDADKYARMLSSEAETYVHEKRYMRRDGSSFWARVSATMARVPDSDNPFLTVAAIEDIDGRRRAESDLLAANRRLEDVVRERTVALDQRDLLLREVYHRVKNNLQIVDSLLAMQAQKLEHPEGKLALKSLRNRIHALGLVHHQLMGSKDLKTFDIAPFLAELSRNILDSGATSGIQLEVEACRLYVGLDFAIPLCLVVTELVTNSLKHAFQGDGGTIRVVLSRVPDDTLALIVSDNGTAALDAIAISTPSIGLGRRLVARLVNQLEGTMTVQHVGGTTTTIVMTAPVMS